MKIFAASAAVLLCFTALATAQEAPKPANLGPPAEPSIAPSAAPPAEPAAGKGVEIESACPEKGAEKGCVLIRYGEDTFDISGADPQVPFNGKGVKIKGVIDTAMGPCIAGTVMKNITWEETSLVCLGPIETK